LLETLGNLDQCSTELQLETGARGFNLCCDIEKMFVSR
jgi:hypothetical protein